MGVLSKIIKVLFVVIIITNFLSFISPSYASLDWSTISGQASSFIERGNEKGSNYITASDMNPLISGLASILTTIGVIIVLIGLLVIGIKYMVATPDEAAKLKTKLVGLAISGVVIIGAYGIWTLAYNFLNRNNFERLKYIIIGGTSWMTDQLESLIQE